MIQRKKANVHYLILAIQLAMLLKKQRTFLFYTESAFQLELNAASYISYKKGFITKDQYHEILDVLKLYKLPIETSDIKAKEVVEATLNDKKWIQELLSLS